MNNVVRMANFVTRRLDTMFPGFFTTAKHNHYRDFGFPETLEFEQFYSTYRRNGIAKAGIEKIILKTWQDQPWLLEQERDGSETEDDETELEKQIRKRFGALRFWQKLAEADRRGMVGSYCGLILRLADSKPFDQPVDRVPGGLEGLVELIPAWEGQLQVSEWDSDQMSQDYGQPKMFQFNESAVEKNKTTVRQFQVHPDRVLIWSADGTVHNRSLLEPGYNDLMTMEKIVGGGGEGFWKNAKSAPVFEIDKDARIDDMARAMNVKVEEIADKMNEQVEEYQQGFDKMLMIQGMKANSLPVNLPSPEHFFAVALQSFAASVPIPMKILVGSQTGERASTEDAEEWSHTNNARRANTVVPNIYSLVERLVRYGILPEKDWFVDWTDLTESSMSEKVDRASKMADVNQKMKEGEIIFTGDEIRAVVGFEPLSDADKFRDAPEDEDAALPGVDA